MELKDIQNLIKFVAKTGVSEVSLEIGDVKITVKTGASEESKPLTQVSSNIAPPSIAMVEKPVLTPSTEFTSQPPTANPGSHGARLHNEHAPAATATPRTRATRLC